MIRRPRRATVALVALPFLMGCFSVTQTAVPRSLPDRQALDLRGVVVTQPDEGTEEVLEFEELHDVTWTPSSLSFVADVRQDGRTETVTRLVPITELQSVMVRQFDGAKTSLIVGGAIVAAVAVITFIVTGDRQSYLPG